MISDLSEAAHDGLYFADLQPQRADAILALIGLHRADARPQKLDLGVGVYRDERGATPVLRAVKAAEKYLVDQQATKAYLGAEGDVRFTDLLSATVFGDQPAASDRLIGVQTPGGTGALRLGAELIARASPSSQVWIGSPTWPNHGPIFLAAGLKVQGHRFFNKVTSDLDFDGMIQQLGDARAGDVVLLHGCCHNPTGIGFSAEQWVILARLCQANGLVPFIDLAYQGLGDGLEEDVAGLRSVIDLVPNALVAYSCDKNFGLYRERVGALWVVADPADSIGTIRDNVLNLGRSLWSMPPDHGAATVRVILDDPTLRLDWMDELEEMRGRINALRVMLAQAHPRLNPISNQRGMFATLPINGDAVIELRNRHAIYLAASGRINIAGLRDTTIPPFVDALIPFLENEDFHDVV